MNKQEQEYMERYIYQVVRWLPKKQRDEIAMELREIIGDMVEEMTLEEALTKLGDPQILASQYRGEHSYVISSEYYDDYVWVLKIVMIAIGISAVVSGIVQLFVTGDWFSNIIGQLISSGLAGFGAVTLLFAALERWNVKVDLREARTQTADILEKGWSYATLEKTPIPDKKGLISRADCVISLIFTVIFSGVMIFAPQLLGAYVFENGQFEKVISLFNLEQWHIILPFILLGLMAGFVDDVIHLMQGRYCNMVMLSSIISGVIQFISTAVVLKVLPLWNENFIPGVEQSFNLEFTGDFDLMTHFGTPFFSNIILMIMFLIFCVEVGTTVYNTVKYGRK
ncbi:MAG: hypothetical protein PHG07_11085 [Lachnospiraceae bacterium]|nr:hypothetical protein [Lachnospiraceae bacterium]